MQINRNVLKVIMTQAFYKLQTNMSDWRIRVATGANDSKSDNLSDG